MLQEQKADRAKVFAFPPLYFIFGLSLGLLLNWVWPTPRIPKILALPAGFLLIDQDFILAPLAESVFPVGYQDAMLLLEETVGVR